MDIAPPPELAEYPVVTRLPVQWGEQDAFNHVNNATYFRWLESARIVYLERIGLDHRASLGKLGPILAAISCNYRRQLTYPDYIQIGSRITRIGASSLTIEHEIWSESQSALVADATSALVVFDYTKNRPQRVPDEIRRAIASIEGREI